eukprot:scaffold4574_cov105-Pinguiococcus_pyrenoidosus.AAC.1
MDHGCRADAQLPLCIRWSIQFVVCAVWHVFVLLRRARSELLVAFSIADRNPSPAFDPSALRGLWPSPLASFSIALQWR